MTNTSEPVALYARVPRETKEAVERYATDEGVTLAAAAHHLLTLGLATAAERAMARKLEKQLENLKRRLEEAERDRDHEIAQRERVEAEHGALTRAADVWADRAALAVGTCPHCQQPLTGRDLLVAGSCAHCRASTAELLAPKANDLDNKELMLMLGAAGLLLGLVVIGSKGR